MAPKPEGERPIVNNPAAYHNFSIEEVIEAWGVAPALEDLPTDTSIPSPLELLVAPAIYEITERIRARS